METIYIVIYIAVFAILFLLTPLIFVMKWIVFGFQTLTRKWKFKEHASLAQIMTKTGQLGMPFVFNASDGFITYKKKRYPLPENPQGRMLNLPLYFILQDDVTRFPGIYYQVTDEDTGEPLYLKDSEDNYIIDEFGNKVPKLSKDKCGAALNPQLLTTFVISESLKEMKKLFGTQSIIQWIAIGALIAAMVSAYLMFDFTSNDLPALMENARIAAQCVVTQ